MQWTDDAIFLGASPHGETSVIAEVFTRFHGRRRALVRGGRGRRLRPALQPGNLLRVTWQGRLEEQLGSFTVEPVKLHAGRIISDSFALAGLVALVSDLHLLPERDAQPSLHEGALLILDNLEDAEIWPALLARFELQLLSDLGFGLDLSRCAVTGTTEDLVWVSPKTGRAVSASAGAPWADRLLSLPAFLKDGDSSPPPPADVQAALELTGHFILRRLVEPAGGRMPIERQWILDGLSAA